MSDNKKSCRAHPTGSYICFRKGLLLGSALVRNGKFLAAFGPAGGKYVASVGGGHAASETMLVHALSTGWLESPFHDASSLGAAKVIIRSYRATCTITFFEAREECFAATFARLRNGQKKST